MCLNINVRFLFFFLFEFIFVILLHLLGAINFLLKILKTQENVSDFLHIIFNISHLYVSLFVRAREREREVRGQNV